MVDGTDEVFGFYVKRFHTTIMTNTKIDCLLGKPVKTCENLRTL